MNSSGKEVYKLSDLDHVRRFLSLGSENGTYYISEQDLTKQCIECINRVLASDTDRDKLLGYVKEYAENNKCKKPDTLVYLLASIVTYKIADSVKNEDLLEFRKKGYELLDLVCTTPTTLFMFINFCKHLNQRLSKTNGWNNLHKRAIVNWYNNKTDEKLVYMLTKYKNRHSYEHRDVFRLCHIVGNTPGKELIYKYIVKGFSELPNPASSGFAQETKSIYDYLNSYHYLLHATEEHIVLAILQKDLCASFAWEHIPTQFLNNREILCSLLPKMPKIALLRNLNRLTRANVLESVTDKALVLRKLNEITGVHPIQMLISLKMYSKGSGDRGTTTWTPNQDIVNALNDGFDRMFNEVRKIENKNVCIALDVSGSMFGANTVSGADCLVAAEVGCAMTMVLQKAMQNAEVMGFSSSFVTLPISHRRRLDDNLNSIRNLPFDNTDCSLPMRWAREKKKKFDAFVIITDNETNCNVDTPANELMKYRDELDIPDAKLVVIATAANNFSIADPSDTNMLDVCGFDASVPDLVCQFINNEL
jgi:60 kDa SS-A/Ro ribonucleoprotein